ncbi:MAG TPA: gluconokinase, GntK/IdnK-type, partial [Burkholderiales bacterium]|nr:gluconokinase, GntK/IdnK-type [Burkholderiales bacterium]
DEFHSAQNIEKMRNGIALQDADRWPWLDSMNAMLLEKQAANQSILLACSALKQKYRDRLADGCRNLHWVYLKGEFDLIRGRLEARKNHYMKAGLLESQFAALEEPRDAVVVSVIETPDAIADRILRDLKIDPILTTGSSR